MIPNRHVATSEHVREGPGAHSREASVGSKNTSIPRFFPDSTGRQGAEEG